VQVGERVHRVGVERLPERRAGREDQTPSAIVAVGGELKQLYDGDSHADGLCFR
jgi:hypothetical protein